MRLAGGVPRDDVALALTLVLAASTLPGIFQAPSACAAQVMGTALSLYSRPSFSGISGNTPVLVLPAPSPDAPCTDLPSEVLSAGIGSAQIQWNRKGGGDPPTVMCVQLWVWTEKGCRGVGTGWQMPHADVADVLTSSYPSADIREFPLRHAQAQSVSCGKYVPNECSGVRCGENAKCVVKPGGAQCVCMEGLVMEHGICVDPCASLASVCPAGSHCLSNQGTAQCVCDNPLYRMRNGQCRDPCELACPPDATCTMRDGRAACQCPEGKKLYQGAAGALPLCADPCAGVTCPTGTTCQFDGSVAVCWCQPGQVLLADVGCSNTSEYRTEEEYLSAHNEARAALGVAPLLWNTSLASRASAWVRTLGQSERCNLTHPPELLAPAVPGVLPYGQNLAGLIGTDSAAGFGPSRGVGVWLREGGGYSPQPVESEGAGGCHTGAWQSCAHYTQVVWRASTHLGCASGPCGAKGWTAWVCNYWPGGNVEGVTPY